MIIITVKYYFILQYISYCSNSMSLMIYNEVDLIFWIVI